jgi:hypothetical protein
MTRLEKMRQYHATLANEVRTLADNYIQSRGTAPDFCPALQNRIDLMQMRMQSLNIEIDKQMAIELGRKDAQVHVPQEFCNA